MKKLLLTTLTVFAFSAQAADFLPSAHDWNTGSVDTAKAAIAAATAENAKAKAVGFEWRDTGKMLKEAAKLATKGDTANAVAMANKAKAQAVNAQQQAKDQANAGPSF